MMVWRRLEDARIRHLFIFGSSLILCVFAATPLFAQQGGPPGESRQAFRDGYGAADRLMVWRSSIAARSDA